MRRLFLALWARQFHKSLRRVAGVQAPDWPRWRARARALEQVARIPGSDDGARAFNLGMATGIQAAVELMEEDGHRAPAGPVGQALIATGKGLTRAMMGLWLGLTRDPLGQVKRTGGFARRARLMWGDGMQVEDRARGVDEISLIVTHCPFASYFWNVGRPELTALFCAYDGAWMEQVNRAPRPVHVHRPSTIAAGAAVCDFAFSRAPLGGGGATTGQASANSS